MQKTIAVLGCSGSVGTQALDVAASRGYKVDLVSINKSIDAAEAAVRRFGVKHVGVASEDAARDLRVRIADTGARIYVGENGICEAVGESDAECVVNSILGEAGLMPSLAVIDAGRRLALANKESLVIAGSIVMQRAKERGVQILPVDSEHSAIFQSLASGNHGEIRRILLTASGGPFFGKSYDQLKSVTLADTLAHPTWRMGKKITVDSATLMNKGFEVIEAAHLFCVPAEKIKVVVHRESILHSAVEYIDNSIIAELSVPDMRMCVQYAVDYPVRCESNGAALDLATVGKLTFADPDTEAFPLLALAYRAIELGGGMGAVLNAADEVAVGAFLEGKIGFTDIFDTVGHTFDKMLCAKNCTELAAIIAADREARSLASEYIREIKH